MIVMVSHLGKEGIPGFPDQPAQPCIYPQYHVGGELRHFMLDIQMMRDPNDIEEAKEVFEYMDYKKAVGLNTGLTDQSAFSEQLIEFANIFGLVPESHRCSLHVVEDSYKEAKKFLMALSDPHNHSIEQVFTDNRRSVPERSPCARLRLVCPRGLPQLW